MKHLKKLIFIASLILFVTINAEYHPINKQDNKVATDEPINPKVIKRPKFFI
ncbi:hypothetical protein [Bacillus sp. EAC]|uniref:hypothetical protein n=1 Tax=Bacillus sp. EAC TaxID=1978338 RepID=UPI0015C520D7|nr:hypothetical protein [Bacillus sp. EAC]